MYSEVSIRHVMMGRVESFGPKGEPSGFLKSATTDEIEINELGLVGDEQADLKNHGGVDKAIMHYAYDHYDAWRQERPHLSSHLTHPGAFGENISTLGLTEQNVCIGDKYQLGTALVEVSQGRQPCWKINHRFGDKAMLIAVTKRVHCGWYYRVLESGKVTQGDVMKLIDRPYPEWTIEKVFRLLVGGDRNLSDLETLNSLTVLSASWLERATRRYHINSKR